MTAGQLLAEQIQRTRDWTLMLMADLQGDDWFHQPQAGLAHPLWLSGHLASAQDTLLFTRCLNKPRLDAAFKAHFPIGGPVKSRDDYDWPGVNEVRAAMDQMQEAAVAAVARLDDGFLNEPAPGKDGAAHPHYSTKGQAIGHLVRHEAFHAGQLAMIRRLLGKPFLR